MSFTIFENQTAKYENNVLKFIHVGTELCFKIEEDKVNDIIKCYEYLITEHGGFFGLEIRKYADWFNNYVVDVDKLTHTDKMNKIICEEIMRTNACVSRSDMEHFKNTYKNDII